MPGEELEPAPLLLALRPFCFAPTFRSALFFSLRLNDIVLISRLSDPLQPRGI